MKQKLDIGRIFDEIFQVYRERASTLLPAAVIIVGGAAIIAALIEAAVGGAGGNFLSSVLRFVAGYWFAGTVVGIVSAHRQGQDVAIGDAFSAVTPVLVTLLVTGFLASIAIAIGLVLLIVPGLFLITRWAVLAPVIVVEKADIGGAFSRSNALVKGNGWQVFGVIAILAIAVIVATLILFVIFAGLGGFLGAAIAGIIVAVTLAPLQATAQTVIYLDLRQIEQGGATAAPAPSAPAPQPPDTSGSTPPPGAPPPPNA